MNICICKYEEVKISEIYISKRKQDLYIFPLRRMQQKL